MNRNSALRWLPAITEAGLPVPKTIIVPYDHHKCMPIFDGEHSDEFDRLSTAVMDAAKEIGFPVFIRTDLTSAKHSGPRAYKIEVDGENEPIARTLEDTEMKCWLEREGPKAFLVREFLTLKAPFTAFQGLPIAREFRFFADENKVHCWHPYWPSGALEDYGHPSCDDWRDKLAEISAVPKHPELWHMAVEAAKACGGGLWSVDFCEDVNGKWWLPDMATAADSFHWPGCPNGSERD
jgi:hypothetical protein